jgi:hypothetical protein
MFVAATLGFAIKLVLDVGQERKAVERLRDNWLVQTSLGYQNYLVQDQGAWETVPLWADKKIYGGDGRPRCRILSIYNQSGNDSQSLGLLPKFKYVSELKIASGGGGLFSKPVAPEIPTGEYRLLRKMPNLTDLELDFPVSEEALREMEGMSLERLNLRSKNWSQAAFDSLGTLSSLKSLNIKADQFTRGNLEAIAKIQTLKSLTLWTNLGYVIERSKPSARSQTPEMKVDIAPICDLPNLEWLSLNGNVSREDFANLKKLSHLKYLNLEYTNVDDSYIDLLLELKLRPELQFGNKQISLETYKTLQAAGFPVQHHGLIFELKENFLRYGDEYCHTSKMGCRLVAQVSGPKSDELTFSLEIRTTGMDIPKGMGTPSLAASDLPFEGDWRELEGKKLDLNFKFNSKPTVVLWFWGEVNPESNSYEFVSRDGSSFHVKGNFNAARSNGKKGEFDARVEFSGVLVGEGLGYDPDDAKALLSNHFDLNDFHEPKQRGTDAWFELKKAEDRE